MATPTQLLFLPGASGDVRFWQPLAERLAHPAERVFFAYPGFGTEPPDASITSVDDLLARVLARIDRPTALLAQSMGGVLAVQAALARPDLVTHLVLTVTSGGVDTQGFGASEWQTDFAARNVHLPRWFLDYRADLSARIPGITQPSLLIWGDDDPISPVAIGRHLEALLPDSTLHVVAGGRHDLANRHAADLAPRVDAHLKRS
ncbi:MAG: 2-hydroxy-6-oxononadienedioate/2-hydroxy-6-oxononatrienedioate hydrolase [Burkholderia plantarii]|nr:MAG: 2-hydroxy-6-oxononadienedioate/2-hydroxy-6-oxononatrienedioate hydrolase [Burkholderia plantarii]